ncbi:acyl-CoA Delta12-desaturase-like [Culicoides brevitarsis]|uniref:acyl-CoA Delta12-desaturase-like n=1 Tax=Culicoides brevitarsis TaxID=469753 RepID=UPI00307BD869
MRKVKNDDCHFDEHIGTDYDFKREVVWFNAIGFLMLMLTGFVGILAAVFGYCCWQTTLWSLLLAYGAGIGVTMGAHRHFTHRAFKVVPWFRVILIILHTIAGQNCLWVWVRDHRQHHKFSDTDADPHNATRGFFFSHVGWLMSKKHPKVIEYGKKIDMSDIEADPLIMFQKRHYKVLYTFFALVIPSFIPLLWGENIYMSFLVSYFGRTAINLNVTWLVNSAAHLYGMHPYNRNIMPVESIFVSLLTVGEGWHNYHHVFPWDYRASELGMPFNVTCKLIDILAKMGIIYDLRQASPNIISSTISKKGDGSHPCARGQLRRTWTDLMVLWAHSLNLPYIFKYIRNMAETNNRITQKNVKSSESTMKFK